MKRILLLLCVLSCFLFAPAQQVWEQKKSTTDLKIYTGKTDGSKFKAVKVECTLQCNPHQLLAVLFDVEHYKDWVYNTKKGVLLKKVSDKDLYYYMEVRAPFPVSNRDVITHLNLQQPEAGTIMLESHAEPQYIPEKRGLVRITSSKAKWLMTWEGNVTKVVYEIRFDPGGSVPAWLVNLFVAEGPYNTFRQLQKRIAMPEYANAHFSFIHG